MIRLTLSRWAGLGVGAGWGISRVRRGCCRIRSAFLRFGNPAGSGSRAGLFGAVVQDHVLVLPGLIQSTFDGFLNIIQADIAGFTQLLAQFFGFQLAVQLGGELADHTPGAANPAASRPGSAGQPFRAQHQQSDNAADQQLNKADIEHSVCSALFFPGLFFGLGLLGLLAFQVVLFGRLLLLFVAHGLLEATNRTAQVRADVAQFLGSEQQDNDAKYDKKLPDTDTHEGSSFKCCCYVTLYANGCLLRKSPLGVLPQDCRDAFSSRPERSNRLASSSRISCGPRPRLDSMTMLWNHRSAVSYTTSRVCPECSASLAASRVSVHSSPTFSRILFRPLACRLAT